MNQRPVSVGRVIQVLRQRKIVQATLFEEPAADLDRVDLSLFTLAPSRYQNKAVSQSGLAPVGITRGYPRFPLGYELFAFERSLAPNREQFQMHDCAAFTDSFLQMLDAKSSEVMATINRHATGASALGFCGLVLLCYEDLTEPGRWCHRRILAQWLNTRHGLIVDELATSLRIGDTTPNIRSDSPTRQA
jgi:hypothetical protein